MTTTDPHPAHPPPSPPADKPTDETIKETFESIVIAFILAFVFRAYVVEAFVIPTGSMAPTLLGEHVDLSCPQCGYRFSADTDTGKTAPALPACPMCRKDVTVVKGTGSSAGDRILVHKYLYSITEPQRWDVVVFKNPQRRNQTDNTPGPTTNYIKRLVGLPNERLWIIDGNIYTSESHGPWKIARKGDRPKVQRAVWQPIYHSRYIPLDEGLQRKPDYIWAPPWIAESADGWALTRNRYDSQPRLEVARSYRYDASSPSSIRFDFAGFFRGGSAPGLYPYNQLQQGGVITEDIEDVRVAATFIPDQAGLAVTFETTARLDIPEPGAKAPSPEPWTIRARVEADGKAVLEVVSPAGAAVPLESAAISPLEGGRATPVEFWFVDQELSLWIDGDRILAHRFELPDHVEAHKQNIDVLAERPPLSTRYPALRLTVSGSPVTLHDVQLDRDLYYGAARFQNGRPGTGVLVRHGDGDYDGNPVTLGPDDFFCLGDNSPRSSDGRLWPDVYEWVEEQFFDDGLEANVDHAGLVPRKLMMGRAFFVYFPAPYSLRPGWTPVIPNFGDMRFIH